ncbi:MAG: hypothetical protein PHQ28_14455 [Mycobacterium sp.]|nr:hypothetical protein [Mycobacterium sp.]
MTLVAAGRLSAALQFFQARAKDFEQPVPVAAFVVDQPPQLVLAEQANPVPQVAEGELVIIRHYIIAMSHVLSLLGTDLPGAPEAKLDRSRVQQCGIVTATRRLGPGR